jgi:hypothetical protein
MLIPKMFASYDETISMAITADVANRVHEEYKKIKHELEESSSSNVQRLKIVHQPVHRSLYLPPQQQALQHAIVQPATNLTYPEQPSTLSIRPCRSQRRQETTAKNRAVTKLGRVHYTQSKVIPEGEPMMMGQFSVAKQPAVILFDSGASHTFNNRAFVRKYQLPIEVMEGNFCIQSPRGQMHTKEVVECVPIDLVGHIFPTDLLVHKN